MLATVVLLLAFVPGRYADVAPNQADGPVPTVWPADAQPPATVPRLEVRFEESAYLPVNGWSPQASPTVRREALALALGLTAVLVAALLVPRRRVLVVGGVALLGTASIFLWAVTRPNVHTLTGTVWLADGQAHQWTWYQSPTGTVLKVPADRQTFLVAYDRQHLASLTPVLRVDAAGRVRELTLTLPPEVPAAIVQVTSAPPAPSAGLSPLRTMVRKLYLRPDVEVAAEGADGVVIRARPLR